MPRTTNAASSADPVPPASVSSSPATSAQAHNCKTGPTRCQYSPQDVYNYLADKFCTSCGSKPHGGECRPPCQHCGKRHVGQCRYFCYKCIRRGHKPRNCPNGQNSTVRLTVGQPPVNLNIQGWFYGNICFVGNAAIPESFLAQHPTAPRRAHNNQRRFQPYTHPGYGQRPVPPVRGRVVSLTSTQATPEASAEPGDDEMKACQTFPHASIVLTGKTERRLSAETGNYFV